MGHKITQSTLRVVKKILKPEKGKYGSVKNWAIGITIAPRRDATHTRTIESVLRTGWNDPVLFCEPDVQLDKDHKSLKTVRRTKKYGCWKNWFTSCQDLVEMYPNADAYGIFQDDVIFCLGVKDFLEASLWPVPSPGLVSVFTPSHYTQERLGWYKQDKGGNLWMAQTFIFTPLSIRNMLSHKICTEWNGEKNIDNVIGRWASSTGLYPYYYTPSLAQHIGKTSTIWLEHPNRNQSAGRKAASDFVGENYNAMKDIKNEQRLDI